jgi:hypothetical protein
MLEIHITLFQAESKLIVSSHDLVVKAEDSQLRCQGSNPTMWRLYFRHHSFRSEHRTRIIEKLYPGIVACAVILQKGGRTLSDRCFIKSWKGVIQKYVTLFPHFLDPLRLRFSNSIL